jgi:hypothetical protein
MFEGFKMFEGFERLPARVIFREGDSENPCIANRRKNPANKRMDGNNDLTFIMSVAFMNILRKNRAEV